MRYLIGFLVTIGLIILLIVLLFGGGDEKKVQVTQTPLTSYANTDTVTRLIIDGPIVAPEEHRQVQITVGRHNTTIEIFRGYDADTMRRETYPMTFNAYANFLHALEEVGYTNGDTDKDFKDERGKCPRGSRYSYDVLKEDGSQIQHFWSTSCGGEATFKGETSSVLNLFREQVPNYNDLTSRYDANW